MKRIINTNTNATTWRGAAYIVDGVEITELDAPLVLATDVVAETPPHDPATQRLDRIPDSLVGTEWRMNRWTVVDLSEEEITANRNAQAEAIDSSPPDARTMKALLRASLPPDISDGALAEMPSLFDYYRADVAYKEGDVRQFDGKTIRCRQDHVSEYWHNPLELLALWTVLQVEVPGQTLPWVAGEQVWRQNDENHPTQPGTNPADIREFNVIEYRCIQSHVTQAGWTPPVVPALWAVVV